VETRGQEGKRPAKGRADLPSAAEPIVANLHTRADVCALSTVPERGSGEAAGGAFLEQKDPLEGTDPGKPGRSFKERTAADLMQMNARFATLETAAMEMAREMIAGGFGSMPVVDQERHLLGIVSEYDLLDAVLSGRDLENLPAKEIMQHPFSVWEDATAEAALRLLQRNHLIRVPVTDNEGKVKGIIARRDLLRAYVEGKEERPQGCQTRRNL